MASRSRRERVVPAHDRVERPFNRPVDPDDNATDERARREQALKDAFEQGRERGFEEGVERMAAELEAKAKSLRDELTETLRQLTILEEERLRETARLIGELGLRAAERIVRDRIADGDPIAVRAIEEAVAVLPATVTVRARLNPEDIAAASAELADQVGSGRLELVADESISRGGCRVESDAGIIDATIETAVDGAADVVQNGGDLS